MNINKILLLIIILALGGLALYLRSNRNKQSAIPMRPILPPMAPDAPIPSASVVDPIQDYDYRTLLDPLTEPGRRPPRHIISPLINSPYLNIPTRGYPDTYALQGYLVDDMCREPLDESRILKLFGRQVYPGSDEWEYFAEMTVGNDKIKVDLDRQHKELYDDDMIYVDIPNRNYRVRLLKQRGLQYNPFLL